MAQHSQTGTGATRQKINAFNVLILIFVGLGSLSFGYSASVISITLGQPSFLEYFALDTRPDAADLEATMNGLYQAGGVIGTLSLPIVADKYGRKAAIAISAILIIISGAFMAGSINIGEFIFFRFISGAGSFMILAAVPIWMNEVVPSKIRGALVDIHAVLLVSGYTTATWVGVGCYYWNDPHGRQWRVPFAIQVFFPLCLLAGLYWIPESPRYFVLKGRLEEAKSILDKLHSDKSDPDNTYARSEFYQIQKQILIDRTLDSSWIHIIKKASYRKRALLAIGTCGIIQCSGVLVINSKYCTAGAFCCSS
jgi:MFS family permease